MVFRFCPQCGKEPLARNPWRPGEYDCPDCKGEFYCELISELPLSDAVDMASIDAAMKELSPSEELQVATVELEEVADLEISSAAGHIATPADGGPAFPRPPFTFGDTHHYDCSAQDGMSLRDWFAGQALAGLAYKPCTLGPDILAEVSSSIAYRLADAMLLERDKEKGVGPCMTT